MVLLVQYEVNIALEGPQGRDFMQKFGLEMGRQCPSNRSNQLFVFEKQAFSQELSHTAELSIK